MTSSSVKRRVLDPSEPIYTVDGVPCITVSAAARAHGISRQGAREACQRGALKSVLAPMRIGTKGDNLMVPVATLWDWTPGKPVTPHSDAALRRAGRKGGREVGSVNGGRPRSSGQRRAKRKKKTGRRSSLTR